MSDLYDVKTYRLSMGGGETRIIWYRGLTADQADRLRVLADDSYQVRCELYGHVPERPGIVIDRDTLEYWAGRDLSDDDVRKIIHRIHNDNYAMLPDLVRTLAEELKADQL